MADSNPTTRQCKHCLKIKNVLEFPEFFPGRRRGECSSYGAERKKNWRNGKAKPNLEDIRAFIQEHSADLKLQIEQSSVKSESGCWIWQGGRTNDYGAINIRVNDRPVQLGVHRVACAVWNGLDVSEPAILACHKCDVRDCCNPEHLFIGTPLDNMTDMKNKGRMVKLCGSRSGMAKLNEEKVAEIRRRFRAGEICADIARHFGVAFGTVSSIKHGTAWRHVA